MSELATEDFAPVSLDNLLDTEKGEEIEVTPAPDEPKETAENDPAPEKEEESKDEVEEAPSKEAKVAAQVPINALLDEREKRKAAEAKLAEFQKEEPATEMPSVFDNESGFVETIDSKISEVEQKAVLRVSQGLAIKEHGREAVQAAVDKLGELAKENPNLAVKFRQSDHPFQEAIDIVAKHEALAEIGDPAEYREKLKAEVRAELEAELADTPDDHIPTSLVDAPSKGSVNKAGSTFTGHTPLESILPE